MNQNVFFAGVIGLTLSVGGFFYLNQQGGNQTSQPMLAASAQEAGTDVAADAVADAPVELVEMFIGSEDAPITVIEYASFTCPHCANFHAQVYGDLVENYVDTGHIRFVLREVYFDRYGLWAGMVARCGGPLRYFGIAEMLMEDQREWVQGEPGDVAQNLRRVGRSAGLSDEQLDVCLTDNAMAQAMVEVSTAASEADEITGTPSFVINGELYSNMNYADFSAILDGLLADEG